MAGINKIIRGVMIYRSTFGKEFVKKLEQVRQHPSAFALCLTCMDARLMPVLLTQSDVGETFIVRNAGNMFPHASTPQTSETVALSIAAEKAAISDVIVCGHSDCKAMNLLYGLYNAESSSSLSSKSGPVDSWLTKHGWHSLEKCKKLLNESNLEKTIEFSIDNPDFDQRSFKAIIDPDNHFGNEDKLSQINTLQQLINIRSHKMFANLIEKGNLSLHAFWFDVYTGNVHLFSRRQRRFLIIREDTVDTLVDELNINNSVI